ncbi:MAG: thioredoxin family protein [Planctomycetota bacterium]
MSDTHTRSSGPSGAFLAITATLALLIALTLQFSALGKLLHPDTGLYLFEAGSAGFDDGLLRDHAIAAFEMLLVVGLLLLHRWKYAWAPTCVFFGGLLGYSLYALVTGLSCGCFGGLWTPPKGFTVGLNAFFIVGSLVVLMVGRARKAVVIASLVATLGAGSFGYYQARVDRPDPSTFGNPLVTDPADGESTDGAATDDPEALQGDDTEPAPQAPVARSVSLFELPELASMMEAPAGTQLGYIFLYEDGCSTCEQFKPVIEIERDDYLAQGVPIEVVMIEMNDLEREHGIPRLNWASTPTLVCIDGGEIVYYDRGDEVDLPSELLDLWLAGEDLGGRDPADDFGG